MNCQPIFNFIFVLLLIFCREEIPISLSNSILISIPKNNQNIDGCEKEELEECVSGDSLTTVNNPEGCEVTIHQARFFNFFFHFFFQVYEETEDNIICACTHLTAFSALFTLNDSNCEVYFVYFLKFKLHLSLTQKNSEMEMGNHPNCCPFHPLFLFCFYCNCSSFRISPVP